MARHQRRTIAAAAAVACLAATVALSTPAAQADSSPTSPNTSTSSQTAVTPVITRFGTTAQRQRGESLADAVARERAKYGGLGIVRLYYPQFPAHWTKITEAVGDTPVSVSFKLNPGAVIHGKWDKDLLQWFRHAPTNRRTFWTYWHEPEDNIARGQFTAEQFRAAFAHISNLSRQAARESHALLRPTLVLMCWTLSPNSGRSWERYYPAGSVRVLGFDCYNAGWQSDFYQDAATVLARAVDVADEVQLPWALTELGSVVVSGDDGSGRATWLDDVSKFAADHGARFVAYFDTNVGVDYRLLDEPSALAWAASVSKEQG